MKNISDYQLKVDDTIRSLGGYWQPLSGLARLLEELGELSELFMENDINIDKVGEELADLFIISTSIANQYCADLNEEFVLLKLPTNIAQLYKEIPTIDNVSYGIYRITSSCGQIGRILNHYEGDKKKKKNETKQRLAKEVALLHVQLIAFSNKFNIPLFNRVVEILNRDIVRDRNRFNITHDPTTEPTLERFRKLIIQEKTQLKKIWGSYEWNSEIDLESNLLNSLQTFIRFSKIGVMEGLDAFIIEIRGLQYIKNQAESFNTINRVLNFYHDRDPLKSEGETELGLIDSELHFSFYGHVFDWTPYIKGDSLFLVFKRPTHELG